MAEYVLESRTKSGAYLATLPFRDLQGEFYYSKTRALRWTMSLASLNRLTVDDIYPAKTEVLLKRDGVPIFVGPLWDMSISKKEQRCNFVAEDLSSYFEKRRFDADQEFSGSLGDIVWQMFSESQAKTNGNLYITRGTAVPTGAPSGNYKADKGQYLSVAAEELYDGTNGFDWTFTADRKYHQFYPKISSRANVRLEYGGNVASYSLNIQGKFAANDVITVGKDKTFSNIAVDTNSQAIYGLLQHTDEQTGTDNLELLNSFNAGTLAKRVRPKDTPGLILKTSQVNPLDGDITFGQIARTVIDDGYVQYDSDMRCIGFQLSVGKHGDEKFNLYLNDLREV